MQKRKRQEAILELVDQRGVTTQEELVGMLREQKIEVTQATVSRDLAELGVVRSGGPQGRYIYLRSEIDQATAGDREAQLRKLLEDLPLRVRRAQGLAVLSTHPGSAQTIAYALDAIAWPEVVGTVAGDDTIFVALAIQADSYSALAARLGRLGAYLQGEQ